MDEKLNVARQPASKLTPVVTGALVVVEQLEPGAGHGGA
jgi:hypothetical protein